MDSMPAWVVLDASISIFLLSVADITKAPPLPKVAQVLILTGSDRDT